MLKLLTEVNNSYNTHEDAAPEKSKLYHLHLTVYEVGNNRHKSCS